MRRPTVETDPITRLDKVAAELKRRLAEAESIRIRFAKALDANLWPTRRSLSRTYAEHETTNARH